MPELDLPLSCDRLLPHREPMLLAGELIEYRPGFARTRSAVGPGNPFLDAGGVLDPMAAVELTAQTIAALKGYEALLRGEPVHIGYLVGIRDFALLERGRAGDVLESEVRQEFAMEQAALMTAEVRRGTERLAAGTIKIWEEKEWPERPVKSMGAPADGAACGRSGLGKSGLPTDPLAGAIAEACEGFEAADARALTAKFLFKEGFLGFGGHFPGYPILPAVIMPRLALAVAGAARGAPLVLRGISQAKIGQGVFPGDRLRVDCALDDGAGGVTIKARMIGPRGSVANFTLECEA